MFRRCFFVIGETANLESNLVKREFAHGNEVGNHTFTHPDFESISKSQLQIELNLTELLLESSLGVKTSLFRPPYGIDHQPETASEVQMLPIPQAMGYIIVGARIDPHDWGEPNGGLPPPADTIVQRVIADATAGKGNIVLMHDGGGDRSHTVEALPRMIDGLRAKGFEFVSVPQSFESDASASDDCRSATRNGCSLAPMLSSLTCSACFAAAIAFIFIAGILLVSGRALVIGLLALVEKLRPSPPDHPELSAHVSVLIPAYNEEAVIVDTVRSVLASNYPKLEVLVIDDGSTDHTAELVRENFGRDPRVRLLLQPNRGKPTALNHGLAEATGEIVVSIDADTIVDPDAIPLLVRHFADPNVGAVAGNVKVMNRNRWLTRWQALEYITSQNLEKRAFDLLNCIPVVPGAAGAWRADVFEESRRIFRRYGCGRYRPHPHDSSRRLEDSLRRRRHRPHRSSGNRRGLDSPALPLDLRHAASRLEASRRRRQAALRNPRLGRDPQYFPVPDSAAVSLAGNRSCCSCSRSLSGVWRSFASRACRNSGRHRTSNAR